MMSEDKKFSIREYLFSIIVFSLIGIFIIYNVFFGIFTNEYQFQYAKDWISFTKFSCVEGFDGLNYGYTGEISYSHGIFDGSPRVPFFATEFTDEQIQEWGNMMKSKLQTLPCYDKYVQLSINNQMLQGDASK